VKAAGELVVFIGEFATRMKATENQFNGGHTLFRVNIHRHAATVIDHFQRLIGVQDHFNAFCMTR